jgi:hypothetical protein
MTLNGSDVSLCGDRSSTARVSPIRDSPWLLTVDLRTSQAYGDRQGGGHPNRCGHDQDAVRSSIMRAGLQQ